MKRIHRPTKYGVITSSGVTYGWRCALCNIPSKRYATRALRDQRLAEHLSSAK